MNSQKCEATEKAHDPTRRDLIAQMQKVDADLMSALRKPMKPKAMNARVQLAYRDHERIASQLREMRHAANG